LFALAAKWVTSNTEGQRPERKLYSKCASQTQKPSQDKPVPSSHCLLSDNHFLTASAKKTRFCRSFFAVLFVLSYEYLRIIKMRIPHKGDSKSIHVVGILDMTYKNKDA
jgi:hypothetical protein